MYVLIYAFSLAGIGFPVKTASCDLTKFYIFETKVILDFCFVTIADIV